MGRFTVWGLGFGCLSVYPRPSTFKPQNLHSNPCNPKPQHISRMPHALRCNAKAAFKLDDMAPHFEPHVWSRFQGIMVAALPGLRFKAKGPGCSVRSRSSSCWSMESYQAHDPCSES